MRLTTKILALVGAAGIALGVVLAPKLAIIDADAVATPELVELTIRVERRCPYCGWIESKREILPSVGDPGALRVYEYTLRMGDGSSSVFQEPLPSSWRLGERVLFIDGTRPNN
jgi:hypothetical protein